MGDSPRRLILGRLPEDVDPTRDIPLGAWCFVDDEDRWPGWENLPFHDACEPVEAQNQAGNQVCGLAEAKLLNLAERLNRQHGVDYSPIWWQIVLMPWLMMALSMMWTRYLHLRRVIAELGDEWLVVDVAQAHLDWQFRDTTDFYERGNSDPVANIWLLSMMLRSMAPKTWELRPISLIVPKPPEPKPPASGGRLAGLRLWLHGLASRLGMDDVIGLRLSKIAMGMFVSVLPRPAAAEPIFKHRFSWDSAYFGEEFLGLVDGLLDHLMPHSFTETFHRYEQQALLVPTVPGRLRIGTVSQWNEQLRFDAAMRSRAGERLIQVQHGGHYGTSLQLPATKAFEMGFHAFVSWGWKKTPVYPVDIIPLPSPFLSGMADSHRFVDDTLILVGTQARPYRYDLQSTPMPGQWVRYRREKLAFFGGLTPRIQQVLRYRPYPTHDTAFADQPYYQARFPFIIVLNQPLHPALLRCRLLVLDHPGTTLNIAMAANIPTLMFYERDAWAESDDARPIFTAMEKCGMLVASGEEAAQRVEMLWDDVQGWWMSPEVQAVRQEFCRNFARTHRWWWLKWISALVRL